LQSPQSENKLLAWDWKFEEINFNCNLLKVKNKSLFFTLNWIAMSLRCNNYTSGTRCTLKSKSSFSKHTHSKQKDYMTPYWTILFQSLLPLNNKITWHKIEQFFQSVLTQDNITWNQIEKTDLLSDWWAEIVTN